MDFWFVVSRDTINFSLLSFPFVGNIEEWLLAILQMLTIFAISSTSNGQSYDFWNYNCVCEREEKNMWKGGENHGGKNSLHSLLYENIANSYIYT